MVNEGNPLNNDIVFHQHFQMYGFPLVSMALYLLWRFLRDFAGLRSDACSQNVKRLNRPFPKTFPTLRLMSRTNCLRMLPKAPPIPSNVACSKGSRSPGRSLGLVRYSIEAETCRATRVGVAASLHLKRLVPLKEGYSSL
jgi:hypothetical protein